MSPQSAAVATLPSSRRQDMGLTEEQRIARMAGIGGSESAAIAGLPSMITTIDIWRGKKDKNYQRPGAFRLDLGNLLEPVILELFRRRTGLEVTPERGKFDVTLKHPSLPLVASPDGFAREQGAKAWSHLMEAKSASKWAMADWGPDGSDGVPKQYLVQCQHNMFVARGNGMEIVEAWVPVLVEFAELRVYRVPYAPDVAEALAKAETAWWEKYVIADRPPPPDGTPSYSDYLLATYPPPEKPIELIASQACEGWGEQYREAHAAMKAAEKRMRQAEQQLCKEIGEGADAVVGSTFKASWRANKNGDRRFYFKAKGDEAA